MNSSAIGSRTSNEALLLRKVASLSAPATAAHQTRNNTARLRKNIERQIRNSNDDQSLQVFIRLMKASHFLKNTEKNATDEKRPVAPPTSPIPGSPRSSCDGNKDVIKTTNLRHRLPRTAVANLSSEIPITYSTLPPSTVVMNAWMSGESPDAWLVMKGRSIRLQHQDHVKNALTTPRTQSATSFLHKRLFGQREIKDFSNMRTKLSNGTPLPPSGRTSRNYSILSTAPVKSHLSLTSPMNERGGFRERNGVSNRENLNLMPADASSSELGKSIVIKIPHLSKQTR